MIKKLDTAGLIMLHNNKLLLTFSKNKKAWYLPGGKIDAGETSQEGLIREIQEELNLALDSAELSFYVHITALAYGEDNLLMEQDCYTYPYVSNISPNNEIEAFAYFSVSEFKELPIQVIGVQMVFDRLLADGMLI